MLTLKDIDDKIASLRFEQKNQMDISKFTIMRAEVELVNLRLRRNAEKIEANDEEFQKGLSEIKINLADALKTARETRTKIQLALVLLEKAKSSLKESKRRTELNEILANAKIEHKYKEISGSVNNIIKKSMAAYFFEKIGDSLLERTKNPELFSRAELEILVESYNAHVNSPITVESLIER